jgi:multiple sugar transport system ATP-binding protein
MIAGLEEITSGEIFIGDTLVNKVPPKNRDIAMVFQSYALYPHMTVFQNISYGLRLRKMPGSEIDERVRAAADTLEIGSLLDRYPKALSGGERQRVALGRAIVREPAAFLFDEPLSNLDAKLRASMRGELRKLHERLGATFVYVTHDQTEAMTMSDRVVVMRDGLIQQVAPPRELYGKPGNMFAAGFIGSPRMNFLDGVLERGGAGFCVNIGGDVLKTDAAIPEKYIGKSIKVGVRPEDIYADTDYVSAHPDAVLRAEVDSAELMGNETYLYLRHGESGGARLIARVSPDTELEGGITVAVDTRKLSLFDAETDKLVICVEASLVNNVKYHLDKRLGERFNVLYPGIDVEIIEIPDPSADSALYETVKQKMRTELMSGSGADLYILKSPNRELTGIFPDVEKAMSGGLFCDLRALYTDPFSGAVYIAEDEYTAALFKAGQIDGKQFTLPLGYTFTNITSNDITYDRLGISDSSGTSDFIAGLRRVFEPSGAGRMAVAVEAGSNYIYLNPYDYATRPLVDYSAETAKIDTALTRDILETGKALWNHTKRLREEGWLRVDQVYSETVSGGFGDYVFSEDYAVLTPQSVSDWQESTYIFNFYGYSPHIDAVPGEGGEINAMVTTYGAIRANSPNKLNALRFLALMQEISSQAYRGNPVRRSPDLGTTPITDLKEVSQWRDSGNGAARNADIAERADGFWSRVASSRYPVPKEVTDIITRYYEGETDLDDTIRRMCEYWEISLSE